MTRSECRRVCGLLDDHLNGELMVETMRDIVAHLESCEECRTELDRRQAVRSSLKRQLDGPMPPSLRAIVRRAVTAEAALSGDNGPRRRADILSRLSLLLVERGAATLARARQWPVPMFATFAIVAVLALRFQLAETPVTAAELLAHSTRIERETVVPLDLCVRRVLIVEERALPSGRIVERRRVELWQNGRTGVAVRRAFDEGSRLLASERNEHDGARTIYRRGAASADAAEGGIGPSVHQLITAREAWRLNLSTIEFLSVVRNATAVHLTMTPLEYEISYELPLDSGELDLSHAVLTLRRADLRPVGQVLQTGRGADVREYRVTEEAYETMPVSGVADKVFETDSALLVLPAPSAPMVTAAPTPVPLSRRPALPRGLSIGAEVEVLYELHRADACLNEGTEIRRYGDAIEVHAVVAAEADRAALVRALDGADGTTDATVRVEVRGPSTVRRGGEGPFTGTPAEAALRRYFAEYVRERLPSGHRISPEEIQRAADEAAGRLIERLRERAAAARQHAIALQALVERFSSARPDGLDVEKTLTWQTMIRDHARGVRRETETIRLELEPLSFAALPRPAPVAAAFETADLAIPASRLLALTESHHTAVLRAFDAGAPSVGDSMDIADTALWRSLLETEMLAQEFDRPWSLDRLR